MCTVMDFFLKSVFVRAGKHTSVHDVHPHKMYEIKQLETSFCSAAFAAESARSFPEIPI